MKEQRWAVIANPFAGRGGARTVGPWLHKALAQRGLSVTLHWTRVRGDAETIARQVLAQGATRIVACGGDGTVHDAVNAIMGTGDGRENVALAIVPLGRDNDLARALGLPKPSRTLDELLLTQAPRTIDVGRAGGRYFTTVAALGFDSAVAEYVDRGAPPAFLRGTPAYLYGVLVHLFRYQDIVVHLKGDFGEFQGPLFMAATGNTHTYGGHLKIAPTAVVDDGLLDVCIIPSISRWEVLRVMPRVFSGRHVTHPAVSLRRTRRLEVQTQGPLGIWADGEPLCQTPATIEVVPKGLTVLAPRGASASPQGDERTRGAAPAEGEAGGGRSL